MEKLSMQAEDTIETSPKYMFEMKPYFTPKPPDQVLFNPYNLVSKNEIVLANGYTLRVDDRVRAILPQLIRTGEIHDKLIGKWAYARYLYNSGDRSAYQDVLQAAEEIKGPVSEEIPRRSDPLEKRLTWTLLDREERIDIARQRRQETTDMIRGTLLDRYHRHSLDFSTQVRLIHRAHSNRNEHIILERSQARRILIEDIEQVDRLSGKIRSDEFPINITLANRLFLCPSYKDVPSLFDRLGTLADSLFPFNEINPRVTEDNIHQYQSFFQMMYAILHPFYEVNGRTSEDLMYILLQRRPDLAHTMRFISNNGFREGDAVQKRMDIINGIAAGFGHGVAQLCGATQEELKGRYYYDDLFPVLKDKVFSLLERKSMPGDRVNDYLMYAGQGTDMNITHPTTQEAKVILSHDSYINQTTEGVYQQLLALIMNNYIDLFEKEDVVPGRFPDIDRLADDLRDASPNYKLADGNVIGMVSE